MSFYDGTCLLKKDYKAVDRGAVANLPLPARAVDRNCFRAEVLPHISNLGDVVGIDGSVHSGSENEPIQGISVKTVDSEANLLQIRVRFPDGTWRDWLEENEFAGTRGRQLTLPAMPCVLLNGTRPAVARVCRVVCRRVLPCNV